MRGETIPESLDSILAVLAILAVLEILVAATFLMEASRVPTTRFELIQHVVYLARETLFRGEKRNGRIFSARVVHPVTSPQQQALEEGP